MKKFLLLSTVALALVLTACADATPHADTDTTIGTDAESVSGTDTDEITTVTDETTDDITDETADAVTDEPAPEPSSVILDVPFIYQVDDYPNGCESVSAVMALRYLGFEIDVDTFIDEYLPCGPRPVVGGIGPDPSQVYCGDPRSKSGWGCYSSVIANTLSEIAPPPKTNVLISHFYGKSLDSLCRDYIDRGIPVIMWATVGMVDSSDEDFIRVWHTEDGKRIEYNSRLHCLVLVGYDEESYYFNDPMYLSETEECYVAYPKPDVERAYSILGMQSIIVEPVG